MYPPTLEQAQKDNHKAKLMFGFALKVEEVHARLYKKALESLQAGSDLSVSDAYLCPVCGNLEFGKPTSKCPICGAVADKYVVRLTPRFDRNGGSKTCPGVGWHGLAKLARAFQRLVVQNSYVENTAKRCIWNRNSVQEAARASADACPMPPQTCVRARFTMHSPKPVACSLKPKQPP